MRTLFKGGTVVSGTGTKRADLLIEIQRFSGASTAQRVQLSPQVDIGLAGYYKILQFQHINDEDGLPVTDLTLERIGAIYEP